MKKLQLFLETSVWNFVFADDAPEKKEITLKFFDKIKKGEYEIFISDMEMINGVNMKKGYYKRLELITPMEVSDEEL
ncbi:MAG: hypothetical protein ACE5H1_01810 [Thermodesulfobacteriota bacterium]